MSNKVLQGIFVIGTDTGVGKTTIVGAMSRSLVSKGLDCGVMKPVETGCRREAQNFIPADGCYLKAAARSRDALSLIAPCRYEAPLAPYAATLQGEHALDFSVIQSAYEQLKARHAFLILEGLGGLMVPLTAQRNLIDLVKQIRLPVLLVARSGLGTLNHTLLTIRYGMAQGITFLGVILNRTAAHQETSERTNLQILSRKIDLPVMGPFPHFNPVQKEEDLIEETRALFEENMDMKTLLDSVVIG